MKGNEGSECVMNNRSKPLEILVQIGSKGRTLHEMRWAAILFSIIVLLVSCAERTNEAVPQFVCFSSDDNGYSGLPGSGSEGGLHWLTQLFESRYQSMVKNGFEGPPPHYTFYVNTYYLDPLWEDMAGSIEKHKEDPVHVKRAWREAIEKGHEIGVHTHSHPHGRGLSVAQWEEEIESSIRILTAPWNPDETPESPDRAAGLGVARTGLVGFRAPFLEYDDNGMTAARLQGFLYDSSIEEMWRTGEEEGGESEGFRKPYRLDAGLPDNDPPIGPQPGLWEIPVYDFLVPLDEECAGYGLEPGMRDRLKKVKDYFLPEYGGITGMDWNLWNEFNLTPDEFLAVLKYTFDRHYEIDRCPMTVGLHSALYTVTPGMEPDLAVLIRERRAAVEAFVDYMLLKRNVHVVSHRELLDWMHGEDPPRPGYALGGFFDDFESPEFFIDPEGVAGWDYLTGEGKVTMDFSQGEGFASITVDATSDLRNVWWAFVKRRVSDGMNLNLLCDPRCELRIEARVRTNTGTAPDQPPPQHAEDDGLPQQSYGVRCSTPGWMEDCEHDDAGLRCPCGDIVNGQLALMDWGLGKYRLDIDYFRVDIVDVTKVRPDEGEPIPYHPAIADPRSFTHVIPVAQDGMIDMFNPDNNLGGWRAQKGGKDIPLVSVGGSIWTVLRWDFAAYAGKKDVGAGLLELTTYSVEGVSDPPPDFGLIRVVEILGGDTAWTRDAVIWNSLLRGEPVDAVINPQMIIDWPPAEGNEAKTFLTIPRPVLQRLVDGLTPGIAIRPLGAIHAAFYSREYDSACLAARLLLNLAEE